MAQRLVKPSDFVSMPWANGKGVTVELAREDRPEGGLLWRLSLADVVEDGDFSRLPGIDRILTLVEGSGFELEFGEFGASSVREPLMPVSFSGDWPARATGVTGPSKDLNVMTARGRATAAVSVHRSGKVSFAAAQPLLLLALAGSWKGAGQIVSAGELLVISGEATVFEGEGVLFAAAIERV
ncbi:HutD/Ves family protein [Radicibacter daui]|uniref:HutD/Ves family protein n=1 Tax=Radicibacter daui TaxID=3064829 RepID=UPI004046DDC2